MTSSGTITELLGRWHEGEEMHAQVMPAVYANLRHIAGCLFRNEQADHTLQPTGLVHEAYIRLIGGGPFENREHFFGTAANAMREALVDYARRRRAIKRGSAFAHVELDERIFSRSEECDEILTINQALFRLESLNPRQAQIVKLRYFAGLSLREATDALDISYATAKADWSKAKKWLQEQLEM